MTLTVRAGRVLVRPPPTAGISPASSVGCNLVASKTVELGAIMASPPFVGKAELLQCRGSLAGSCDYVVAVPVRNEERRLPAMLDALGTAMRTVTATGCVVFVCNDTEDTSSGIVERWARCTGIPALCVEVSLDQDVRNAPHARRLALDIAARAAPSGVLFTTDADTCVGEVWIERGLQQIAAGNDLVCEDVLLDESELSSLPAVVREVGDTERAYFEMCDLLSQYWTRGRARKFAVRPSGASLAIRASAYLSLGGLPLPCVGEDRALYEMMAGAGLAIEALQNGGTRTSARVTSRAAGGCGAALADRASSPDPLCDSHLKPVRLLHAEAMLLLDSESGKSRRYDAMPMRSEPMRFSALRRELAIAKRLAVKYGLIDAA